MGVSLVQYEVKGGIATITLDDPPVNGYTYEMNCQVDEKIVAARFDTDVHVIVLTGAGEKFFCAGANIKMLAAVDPTFKYYFCLHANETLSRLEQTPKLTIAAINGHCVGGGLEVAMACDLRFARKPTEGKGFKLGLPEVNLGVLPGTGGTQRLCRLVGKSKAIELMVEGRTFDFDEAKELGIVNYVYESESHEHFMNKVYEYAAQFVPPNKASMAVGHIKRACQTGAADPPDPGRALEREQHAKLFSSGDAHNRHNSYVQKKKQELQGN